VENLKHIEDEVEYLKYNSIIFKKIDEIVKLEDIMFTFHRLARWVHAVYESDVSLSIRRLVECRKDPNCISLLNLLREIHMQPHLIGIDADSIAEDINRLDVAHNHSLERLVRFADRTRAHRDRRQGTVPLDIDWSEVFSIIDDIESIFVKYYKMIVGSAPPLTKQEYEQELILNIEERFKRLCRML
jgi:hypothetical protein